MAEKLYYLIPLNMRIKLRAGEKAMNKAGEIITNSPLKVKLSRPANASIGLTLADIAIITARQNSTLTMTKDVEKDIADAVERLAKRRKFANSEAEFIALTSGKKSLVRSQEQVDLLSKQVNDARRELEKQAQMIAEKNNEVAELKAKLGRK